ncbi:hypothetical protein AU476_13885 [Cupriavidus sp. UYMSc13B]|nr:hypothetical protein AU476_13885 [Cupriavidus sp. UYMSc13B]
MHALKAPGSLPNAIAAVAVAAMLSACGSDDAPQAVVADAVYTNAKVLTVDANNTVTEAFAVKEGRFLAVGESADIRKHIGANTTVVDFGGRTVVPGLSDGHIHDVGGGPGIDLSQTRSIAEMLATLSMAVAKANPGDLLISNPDWYHGQLNERRMRPRASLIRWHQTTRWCCCVAA